MERVAGTAKPEWFWGSGAWSVRNLSAVLGLVDKRLTDFGRIVGGPFPDFYHSAFHVLMRRPAPAP